MQRARQRILAGTQLARDRLQRAFSFGEHAVEILRVVLVMMTALGLAHHGTARAWTRSGHMVTAAIAYFDLGGGNSPIVERIVEIMASHPEPS